MLNPATPVQTLGEVLDIVDYVLIMSVNPGFGGQKFLPATLEKVRKLATMRVAKGLNFRIEIDGGMSLDTIGSAVKAGVEIVVAGKRSIFPRRSDGECRSAAESSPGSYAGAGVEHF